MREARVLEIIGKRPVGGVGDSDAQLSETYEYGTCPDGLSDLRRAGRDI